MTRPPRRPGAETASPLPFWLAALAVWSLAAVTWAAEGVHFEVRVGEPAVLSVWNRPVATLHAEIDGITTKDRVARIASKIADALEALTGAGVSAAPPWGLCSAAWSAG